MTIKLAFIVKESKFPAKLTKIFTGCYCYHVGFHDVDTDTFYDMNWSKRGRKNISTKYKSENVVHFDCPVEVTVRDLEDEIIFDNKAYGVIDYFLFSIRWLFHLFGKSTPNAGGLICSEWVNNVLIKKGWKSPFTLDGEVPSPCDLINYFNQK